MGRSKRKNPITIHLLRSKKLLLFLKKGFHFSVLFRVNIVSNLKFTAKNIGAFLNV